MSEQSLLNKDPRASFIGMDSNSSDWELAWNRLNEEGYLRIDYMLVFKDLNKGVHAFKHHDSRQYVYIHIDPRKQ